jgi:hypothetical protein
VRNGYTCDEIRAVLDLKTQGSVTNAVDPQLRKMLRLFLHDPVKFLDWALPVMEQVAEEMRQEAFERGLQQRVDMGAGRVDRESIHPNCEPDAAQYRYGNRLVQTKR